MKRRRGGRATVIFLCCTLAVPTVSAMMGVYGGTPTLEQAAPALMTGAVLGLIHLIVRPILRLISAPLGCLTLGLIGFVIDVGLIYAADYFVPGYEMPGLLCAILTAVLINAICAVVAGRR